MSESPGTDLERRMSSPGVPRRWSSKGMVTKFSTSSADMPRAMVWISTLGGANSGKTSTSIVRSCWDPNTSNAAEAAINR